MRSLIVKLFIKNHKNVQSAAIRNAYGKLSGIVGIVSNTFLCVGKIITGILTGSVSILADGINNLSDVGTSIITVIGFKLSATPADERHPYGHQRIEYITGLIVSFIIFLIGGLLLKSSIETIITPRELAFEPYAIVLLVVSIGIKFWQSNFYRMNGKTIQSSALIATATDSLYDCISTSVVLIAFLVSKYTGLHLDGYMGVVVSIFIIISAFGLIKDTISPLIGEAPTKEAIQKIYDTLTTYDGVLGVHDLHIHSYGPIKKYITVHIEVDASVHILESHALIDTIEKEFMKKEGINMVIHMDPIDTSCSFTQHVKDHIATALAKVDEALSFHDLHINEKASEIELLFDVAVPPSCMLTDELLQAKIQEELAAIHHHYRIRITLDRNYML